MAPSSALSFVPFALSPSHRRSSAAQLPHKSPPACAYSREGVERSSVPLARLSAARACAPAAHDSAGTPSSRAKRRGLQCLIVMKIRMVRAVPLFSIEAGRRGSATGRVERRTSRRPSRCLLLLPAARDASIAGNSGSVREELVGYSSSKRRRRHSQMKRKQMHGSASETKCGRGCAQRRHTAPVCKASNRVSRSSTGAVMLGA